MPRPLPGLRQSAILTAPIGAVVEFIDDAGLYAREAIAARRDGVTITKCAREDNPTPGCLSAWVADAFGRPSPTGWIFGSATTPEAAIDRVINSARAWAGLAAGQAAADAHGD